MSSAILTVLDHMGKSISRLRKAITKGDLKLIKARYENLVDFSDCIQSLLPKEFVETAFRGFNSHLSYLGTFIGKRFFDYIESNFNDLADIDFPELKTEIYSFLEKSKLPERKTTSSKNVFIVHGRNHAPMKELKSLICELGLNPVVLHEQPSGSRTIVEKLEQYSKVGYAFVILTPDDIGTSFQDLFERTARHSYEDGALEAARRILKQSKGSVERFIEFNEKFMPDDPSDAVKFLQFLTPRARQNVVLEFGYFIGKLERDRVCCLHKGGVELPSDMLGIVYIPFKDSVNEVKDKIIKELKAAGYEIKI